MLTHELSFEDESEPEPVVYDYDSLAPKHERAPDNHERAATPSSLEDNTEFSKDDDNLILNTIQPEDVSSRSPTPSSSPSPPPQDDPRVAAEDRANLMDITKFPVLVKVNCAGAPERFRVFIDAKKTSGAALAREVCAQTGLEPSQIVLFFGTQCVSRTKDLLLVPGFGRNSTVRVEAAPAAAVARQPRCAAVPLPITGVLGNFIQLADDTIVRTALDEAAQEVPGFEARGTNAKPLKAVDFLPLANISAGEPAQSTTVEGTTVNTGYSIIGDTTDATEEPAQGDAGLTIERVNQLLGVTDKGTVSALGRGAITVNARGYPVNRQWMAEQEAVTRELVDIRLNAEDESASESSDGGSRFAQHVALERDTAALAADFEATASRAVELILENKVRPVDFGNLIFPGSNECLYVIGGILLRRVGGWIVDGQPMGNGDPAFRLAAAELAALRYLQRILQLKPKIGLQVPASCIVDHLGQRFIAYALFPVEQKHVLGGSCDDGFSIQVIKDKAVVDAVRHLARAANLAPHATLPARVLDPVVGEGADVDELFLKPPRPGAVRPVDPKHHLSVVSLLASRTLIVSSAPREGEAAPNVLGYIVSAVHSLPPDVTHELEAFYLDRNEPAKSQMYADMVLPTLPKAASKAEEKAALEVCARVRRFRPELVQAFSIEGQTKTHYTRYTSLHPRLCDHCKRLITEFEFYEYDDSTKIFLADRRDLVKSFDLCLECARTEDKDAFAVPFSRLRRVKVPYKERVEHWRSERGKVKMQRPIVRTALNPEALTFPRTEAGVMRSSGGLAKTDEELLLQAAISLHEEAIPRLLEDLDNLRFVPDTPSDLVAEMHRRGINARYLGRIAAEVSLSYVQEMSLREIFGRTVKVLIRDGISFLNVADASETERTADINAESIVGADLEEEAKAVIVTYLNALFSQEATEHSDEIWEFVQEISQSKFGEIITREIRNILFLPAVARDVCRHLGVRMDPDFAWDLDTPTPFGKLNVHDIRPVPRSVFIPETLSETETLIQQASALDASGRPPIWHSRGGPEREQASALFRRALEVAEEIYGVGSVEAANAKFILAKQLKSRFEEGGRPEFSRWNRCAAIPPSALSREVELLLREALLVREKAFALGALSPIEVAEVYFELADVLFRQAPPRGPDDAADGDGPNSASLSMLLQGVYLMEAAIGFHHPTMAQLYIRLSNCFLELGEAGRATTFIRRAFMTNILIFGDAHPITLDTHRLLRTIETAADSGLDALSVLELQERLSEIVL